ncbi:hypothetical protein GSI_03034 [Ganoderma sinense ZZ0214-1]|uniref:Uncharacterized protein n=1 Tax=Ganoderma sinense ZZ0214-1 TaxID=1077348 RepID=A0A2G8SNA1_9APHY|nr:hypothetical protein GSI_03034 [Ganoderma sinense ZZ0214-1]
MAFFNQVIFSQGRNAEVIQEGPEPEMEAVELLVNLDMVCVCNMLLIVKPLMHTDNLLFELHDLMVGFLDHQVHVGDSVIGMLKSGPEVLDVLSDLLGGPAEYGAAVE